MATTMATMESARQNERLGRRKKSAAPVEGSPAITKTARKSRLSPKAYMPWAASRSGPLVRAT